MSSVLPTSITCPSPPRYSPAPPESVRNSFFQISTGASVSVISTATLRTPVGKAVALSPSERGRAPVPPGHLPNFVGEEGHPANGTEFARQRRKVLPILDA